MDLTHTHLLRKKDIGAMLADYHSPLKKELKTFDLTMLGIGAIIGTGIFVLTGTGALIAGPGLMISFVLAAIACLFASLCYAEFAAMVPESGSAYTYSYTTLGEIVAFIIGWDLMLEYLFAVSTVSAGWSGYFQSFIAGFGLKLPTVLTAAYGSVPGVTSYFNLPAFTIIMLITLLLSLGVKETKRINDIMVVIKLAVVLLFIFTAVRFVKPANWTPLLPFGMKGVFGAASSVFFAFIGFDAISSSVEETLEPAKTLPKSMLLSLGICTVLYVAVSAIMTGVVPFRMFAKYIDHPISAVLVYSGQNWLAGIVDLGAILGMTTVMLVCLYGQTRISFSMSRDGLLPPLFSRISKKTGAPVSSTVLFGCIAAIIGGLVPLADLAELVNIGTLTAFVLVSFSILRLRKTQPNLRRPFRTPFVPFVPIMSIICCVFLLINLKTVTWLRFVIWLAIGMGVYFGYSVKHSKLGTGETK
ncbi:amino acid permease [Lactiplantibacillus mudanjiangensis]|uniref:Amino acid transport protein [Lactobacillus plantarum ZJ316] n=1 Tax=Lactiplantibacillus mudanjiangensis TaxID=1296538 RepID=A0A660E2N8_9LACO|nr:amino acid permease [Lactiplantibacillus mudanjiangensis]VDG23942.1 Amino acid transport protein [Lactobacillus plantarum ZJ316] [Lactiplantibacillus mudanjiangensis]VDG27123.1 Amino acid transport protein [Lactobacillus plantarum ZJ316] [Lactiplantibacillus mudanjiangensis]VDG33975.1 Amino acid transport protein [Lactobacillus plantarum ZJ316] [Lactiplantibacillus mudanjiangensis]